MPPQNRKRFNAFEDFPAQPETATTLPSSIKPIAQAATETPLVERIERLKPSQMLPDRFQPRRLLPPAIRDEFFSAAIDCYTAASRWLILAKSDPAVRGEVDRLLAMGGSFGEHGQIKPITGSWIQKPDGGYVFMIETGERRFWAACLEKVNRHHKEEPLLRVEVVAHPTRQRQVLENRHAEQPSAVEQACEISALILSEIGIHPGEATKDEYEYFRLVRTQRMPAGLWEKIIPIMQLTRPRMVQLLNILQFPSPLLDLADRYRLPERVLREVLSAPEKQWERMLQMSIQSQLTSEELSAISDLPVATGETAPRPAPPPADPGREAGRNLRRFARTLGKLDSDGQSHALDTLADELVVLGQAQPVLSLLEELTRLIRARIKRR
jgi:hypothetical protein